ncbi:MAG: ribosome biogenesis GTP-binding protein YsxC [Rickettsiales bacterium]|nr:ribosome biogenesis GTP-binding protein YsxC [Rickettsiales bacterium]|tara:strand:- start:638 stop:1276 length:639 start_codon:yes stop_codon:yes gene_type:complete
MDYYEKDKINMKSYNFSEISNVSKCGNFEDIKIYKLPEFCFAGRSNVGKSSIINSLLNRKKIATTSNRPGHTKNISFYKINNSFIVVDLPGYGFANVSKRKTEELSKMLFLYLTQRQEIKIIFVLIDSRHGIKDSDKNFIYLLERYKLDYQVVFTKFDKVSLSNKESLLKGIENYNKNIREKVIFSSSKTKAGINELRREILCLLGSRDDKK